MIKQTIFAIALLASTLLVGCELHEDAPLNEDSPSLAAFDVVERPANPCGTSSFVALKDANGQNFGSIELINDADDLFVIFQLNHGYVMSNFSLYAGSANLIPQSRNSIKYESFPHQVYLAREANAGSYKVPVRGLPTCPSILLKGKVSAIDMFGNSIGTMEVTMGGAPFLDGFNYEHCLATCSSVPVQGN